jgi:hypothetical protein
MYLRATKPLSALALTGEAIKLYRAAFRGCAPLALLGGLALLAADSYQDAQIGAVPDLSLDLLQDLDAAIAQLYAYVSPGALRAYVLGLVLTLLFYLALMIQLHAHSQGVAVPSAMAALRQALRRLPAALLASLIFIAAVSIGLLLLLLPGLYGSGRLQMWPPAMIVDRAGGIESLGRSWDLTQQQWWHASTALTLALLLLGVSWSLWDAIAGIGGGIGSRLLQGLGLFLLLPTVPASWLVVYYDLQLRRNDGTGAARLH